MNGFIRNTRIGTAAFFILALLASLATFGPADFLSRPVASAPAAAGEKLPATTHPNVTSATDRERRERVAEGYGKLPMSFEANRGQTDARVKFLARGDGYSLFLTSSEAVLSLSKSATRETGTEPSASHGDVRAGMPERQARAQQDVLRMKLLGANPSPRAAGLEE